MRVNARIHVFLNDVRIWCHLTRLRAVVFAVEALLAGGVLTLTGLGRARVGENTAAKHQIKRVDRLLGNTRLALEVDAFSSLLARKLIGQSPRPLLLVDWTPLWGRFHALTAAVPCDGRALLVYWQVHSESFVNKTTTHNRFLKKLATVVPTGSTPIIVTDAGFHAPWFKAVRRLGWDYLGRVRGLVKCDCGNGRWVEVRSFHSQAKTKATDLGCFTVSKTNPIEHRLVLVRQRQKPGPKKQRLTHKQRPGPKKKGHRNKALTQTEQGNEHRKRALEPWVLATSLLEPATTIVGLYKRRMQTEETYRHLKSVRYGWELAHGRSTKGQRLRVLLLVAALAAAILTAIGIAAEAEHLHHRYQANTIKHRRVLSLLTLAQLVVRDRALVLNGKVLKNAFLAIQRAAGGML